MEWVIAYSNGDTSRPQILVIIDGAYHPLARKRKLPNKSIDALGAELIESLYWTMGKKREIKAKKTNQPPRTS